jgi:membrane protein implicated in regulation of membrane protease activity
MSRRKRLSELDRHRRQTYARLVIGGFLILLVVGGGLVWLLYGRAAALTAIACLLIPAGLLGLLWLILTLLELWVGEDDPD